MFNFLSGLNGIKHNRFNGLIVLMRLQKWHGFSFINKTEIGNNIENIFSTHVVCQTITALSKKLIFKSFWWV